jgi:hypothetical protein
MDLSKKLLYGGIAAVVSILVVIFIVAQSQHKKTEPDTDLTCSRTKDKPDMNLIRVKNILSPDKIALANMAGYVRFSDNTYLPLDIESVTVVSIRASSDVRMVSFSGRCFSFDIHVGRYTFSVGNKTISSYNVLDSPSMFVNERPYTKNRFCYFFDWSMILVPSDQRFSCTTGMTLKCEQDWTSLVARLVLESFELQLDGNSSLSEENEFETEVWEPSCYKWNRSTSQTAS